MALSFLKDRDENAVLGNLGNFASTLGGNSVQAAIEIYRKDQKSHHEKSIASDLTRGLLRKVFRETVLESSKQIKRKYSYSAVGSTMTEEVKTENMGIMAKLKKLQKERLIVARLGFPDKAMEIDDHIEKIRADLREEREKEDMRIMEEVLASLVAGQKLRLSNLEHELKQDAKNKHASFEDERSTVLRKQEQQFAQLVDDAIKRAIGKSKSCSCTKKYLCHHNKTASFNTRRPKKEVIHFRKNAKRLRHGGRLDESAAWEEKAAELDAEHLDRWREEVAASLTASAWGGSSSALDQLASQHQREISRMETAQANDWTLMLMRHRTLRRNCNNAIMVEQKKLRNTCKKNAEERHRREMLGVQEALDGKAAPEKHRRPARPVDQGCSQEGGRRAASVGEENVASMLQDVLDDGMTGGRTPVRPSSAPPGRGRRPQPNQQGEVAATAEERTPLSGGGSNDDSNTAGDENVSAGDSRDLQGFQELERTDFLYDEYPMANSSEEAEWVHIPWHGANSDDTLVPDDPPQPHLLFISASQCSSPSDGGVTSPRDGPPDGQAVIDNATRLTVAAVDESFAAVVKPFPLATPSPAGENKGEHDARNNEHEQQLPVDLLKEYSRDGGRGMGPVERVASRRLASDGGLIRYDWDATKIPVRPALSANSRIPSGSRAEKIKAKNARRKNPHQKVVSWGENLEVPPEINDDDDESEGENERPTDNTGLPDDLIDDIVDGFVEEEGNSDTCIFTPGRKRHSLSRLDQQEIVLPNVGATEDVTSAGEVAAGGVGVEEQVYPKFEESHKTDDDFPSGRQESGGDEGGIDGSVAPETSTSTQRSQSEGETQTLQNTLDLFCSIRLLHGDWVSLLQQIVGHEACWRFLHRWSDGCSWARDVDACTPARFGKSMNGSLSWGSVHAAAVRAASPEILAPFVASLSGQEMVRSPEGRMALGGSTVAEEPALARSRRPWRTLFERSLGALPHGAILSLTRNQDSTGDGHPQVAFAGKVLWANEAFERMSDVDATDVVGKNLASLFDVGLDRGTELTRSLELGQDCAMWITMARQRSDPTDVLCIHQSVSVPPELSDEGNYYVMFFFDTATVLLQDEEVQINSSRGRGGHTNDTLTTQEWHRDSVTTPKSGGSHTARRQCCSALSSAILHILTSSAPSRDTGEKKQDPFARCRQTQKSLVNDEVDGDCGTTGEKAVCFLRRDKLDDSTACPHWRDSGRRCGQQHAGGLGIRVEEVAGQSREEISDSTTEGRLQTDYQVRNSDVQPIGHDKQFDSGGDDFGAAYGHDSCSPPSSGNSFPGTHAFTEAPYPSEIQNSGPSSSLTVDRRIAPISTFIAEPMERRVGDMIVLNKDIRTAIEATAEYSSGDDSPGPRDDLLQSPEGIADPTEAAPIERMVEGCRATGEGNIVFPRETPRGSFIDEVDAIGKGDEVRASIHPIDGYGSGDDQYEEDFFSDESSPPPENSNENTDQSKNTVGGFDVETQPTILSEAMHCNPMGKGTESPFLESGATPIFKATWDQYKDRTTPLWQEKEDSRTLASPEVRRRSYSWSDDVQKGDGSLVVSEVEWVTASPTADTTARVSAPWQHPDTSSPCDDILPYAGADDDRAFSRSSRYGQPSGGEC